MEQAGKYDVIIHIACSIVANNMIYFILVSIVLLIQILALVYLARRSIFVTRIYTENKNIQKIQDQTDDIFEGYTMLEGIGRWERQNEKSLVIEIIGSKSRMSDATLLAHNIKQVNDQDAVLITESSPFRQVSAMI